MNYYKRNILKLAIRVIRRVRNLLRKPYRLIMGSFYFFDGLFSDLSGLLSRPLFDEEIEDVRRLK